MAKNINIYETDLCKKDENSLIKMDVMIEAFKNAGITINIYNIWEHPELMTGVRQVEYVLEQDGVGAMPITVVGDEIFKKGAYPDYRELLLWSEKLDK